ncbi:class I SAM-dependent DNA methyltransferase [Fusibacter ferrireducens]|uniref:Class I SAM-dependent methyltransferase n=1 Tax=Fusibacter ferrireducens TaxID=2785058 RepID=A0ABR9ZTL9_9FIRM|nr:methyltransferase [Fusibacter ferrireducens]MBF4693817.1 class I SAM-dependent methyltransferase [Fusibacter ferrireducens]
MNFDQLAKKWDDEKNIERGQKIAEAIKSKFKSEHYVSGLEFGCGTALVSFNLKSHFDKLLLIDSSEGMIEIVQNKINALDSESVTHIQAIKMDLTCQPLEEKFDVIYCSMVLHHIPDVDHILSVLYEHLNENGEICIVEINKEDGHFHGGHEDFHGHDGFGQQELADKLKTYGFKNIASENFYSGVKATRKGDVPYSLFILNAVK